MSEYFSEVKKTLGFGCMRPPMIGNEVDYEQFSKMVDAFLENGFNYFDTAHGYVEERSELVLKKCLTSRYPRDKYVLANKLSDGYFNSEEEIRPLFEKQLECCGVDYFDFYLMHGLNRDYARKFIGMRGYETMLELKKEGKIRHVGFSFHDNAEVLEQILKDFPEVEFVQLQFNYLDYDDSGVQGRACYEVCRKYGKPVIVMEPVKGGGLVDLPENAKAVLENLGGGSPASYAIRYAAGFDGVMMVLSGMSNMEQMTDNISFMKDFVPLSQKEHAAIDEVCKILLARDIIPCTSCKYCVSGCVKKISIPDLFACLNAKKQRQEQDADLYSTHTKDGGKASECIECGKCEAACPQHLEIRRLLKEVAAQFEG